MYSKTFYQFVVTFMEKYPEFKGRDLFVAGVSYGGSFVPAVTSYMIDQGNPDIKLKAIGIGNGWVKPITQYYSFVPFSLENNLISPLYGAFMKVGYFMCEIMIRTGLKAVSFLPCQLLSYSILGPIWNPAFSIYDIRLSCEDGGCDGDLPVVPFLNQPEIQDFLNVPRREFTVCNTRVHKMLLRDFAMDMTPKVQHLLDNGVGVLVYSGDKDLICNWRGGEAWTNTLKVDGQTLESLEYSPWTVDGEAAGEYRKLGGLTFLRFYDAGHAAPADQPERGLAMFKKFLSREF